MKKFLLFILTLAYVATSSGAPLYIHQCMGKILSWDIMEDQGNSCMLCSPKKTIPNDCCQEHVQVLKVHNDQNLPNTYFSNISLPEALPVDYYTFSTFSFPHSNNKIAERYPPPGRSSKINYCILYCSFLI